MCALKEENNKMEDLFYGADNMGDTDMKKLCKSEVRVSINIWKSLVNYFWWCETK